MTLCKIPLSLYCNGNVNSIVWCNANLRFNLFLTNQYWYFERYLPTKFIFADYYFFIIFEDVTIYNNSFDKLWQWEWQVYYKLSLTDWL